MERWLLTAGSVLVAFFAAYTLVAALGDVGGSGGAAPVLGALSLLGLILLTASALVKMGPRRRRWLTVAGAGMVLTFLAYGAIDRGRDLADDVSAATLFGTLGAVGLLLVVSGTTLRKVRS